MKFSSSEIGGTRFVDHPVLVHIFLFYLFFAHCK